MPPPCAAITAQSQAAAAAAGRASSGDLYQSEQPLAHLHGRPDVTPNCRRVGSALVSHGHGVVLRGGQPAAFLTEEIKGLPQNGTQVSPGSLAGYRYEVQLKFYAIAGEDVLSNAARRRSTTSTASRA